MEDLHIKPNPLSCTIFVDTPLVKPELMKLLVEIIDGKTDGRESLVSKVLDVGIQDNELFNSPRFGIFDIPLENAKKRFLYYRYRIEVDPFFEKVSKNRYTQAIAHLMEGLWDRGIRLATACGFESELPRMGGNLYDPNKDPARKIISLP